VDIPERAFEESPLTSMMKVFLFSLRSDDLHAHIFTLTDGRLLAIDEISGILDHSDECNFQIEMERDTRLPLNQELREYALGLLRKNSLLSLLCPECSAWAEQKWPGSAGDNFSRHKLTTHDTSSLYRTISRERGTPQRTAAEDNLDLWFRKEKSQPPSPALTDACLHYQPHRFPETDRFEIILSTLCPVFGPQIPSARFPSDKSQAPHCDP